MQSESKLLIETFLDSLWLEKNLSQNTLESYKNDLNKFRNFLEKKEFSWKNLEKKLDDISTPITVSIIGCVVNGPGEATMTNIGITGGGNDTHMIYLDGKKNNVVKNVDLENYLEDLIRKKTKEIELSN